MSPIMDFVLICSSHSHLYQLRYPPPLKLLYQFTTCIPTRNKYHGIREVLSRLF